MPALPSLNFNVSPAPRAGQGAYGAVPGQIGLPPSIWSQTGQAVPGLPALTKTATDVTGSYLKGQVPSDVQNFLQQKAAQYGVSSGMPGSGFANNNLVRSLGLSSLQLQQTGLDSLKSLLGTVGGMQLDPSLISHIGEENAMYGAAPDPRQAAMQQIQTMKDLYDWEQNKNAPETGTWDAFGYHGMKNGIPIDRPFEESPYGKAYGF